VGIARKRGLPPPDAIVATTLNGLAGFFLHLPEGVETLALQRHGERIAAIYAVRNPDKLRHFQAPKQSS
jgi:RNA polymerase sigma-70 factor (ECF subfamily)